MQAVGTSPTELYHAVFPSATPTATNAPPPTLTPTPTLVPTPTITLTATVTPTANAAQAFLATFTATPDAAFVPVVRDTAGQLKQVWVPAGSFMAGDRSGQGFPDELLHQVYTDAFWIDQYLVTNQQFAQCPAERCGQPQMLDSHKRPDGYYGVPAYADYPVMQITWQKAESFCEWRGGRLPTEAEWEKAAGWDPRTSEMRTYPWGNQPPDKTLANYGNVDLDTTQVGAYPKAMSAVGAYDMAGDIWEWIYDWYGNYDPTVGINPMGPSSGEYKVVRGGSWSNTTLESYLRVSNRGKNMPDHANNELGFRCVSAK